MKRTVGHNGLLELQQQSRNLSVWKGFSSANLELEYARKLRLSSATARFWLMVVPLIAMLSAPLYGAYLLDSSDALVLWLRVIEFGVVAPICLFTLVLLRRRPEARLTTTVMVIALIVVFWAVALIRWMGAGAGGTLHIELVMIVPLAVAAVGRLRMLIAAPFIVVNTLLLLAAEWWVSGGSGFAQSLLSIGLFASVAFITAISTDQLARRSWITREIVALSAMSDAVTGLPNRQWLNRDLNALFNHARRCNEALAVFLIDLDHFKKLNDTHGHAAGDEALRKIGILLASYGRRAMDMAARYGGEEFVLVLHNPKLHGTVRIAERLLHDVTALGIENRGAPSGVVTASIGIYTATPALAETPEQYLHEADLALYRAKAEGRNRYVLQQATSDEAPATATSLTLDEAVAQAV